jgi:hypothetical protein
LKIARRLNWSENWIWFLKLAAACSYSILAIAVLSVNRPDIESSRMKRIYVSLEWEIHSFVHRSSFWSKRAAIAVVFGFLLFADSELAKGCIPYGRFLFIIISNQISFYRFLSLTHQIIKLMFQFHFQMWSNWKFICTWLLPIYNSSFHRINDLSMCSFQLTFQHNIRL